MKNILTFIKMKKKVPEKKSLVYSFFAESNSKVKVKAYKQALRDASQDQMLILSRYEKSI